MADETPTIDDALRQIHEAEQEQSEAEDEIRAVEERLDRASTALGEARGRLMLALEARKAKVAAD